MCETYKTLCKTVQVGQATISLHVPTINLLLFPIWIRDIQDTMYIDSWYTHTHSQEILLEELYIYVMILRNISKICSINSHHNGLYIYIYIYESYHPEYKEYSLFQKGLVNVHIYIYIQYPPINKIFPRVRILRRFLK